MKRLFKRVIKRVLLDVGYEVRRRNRKSGEMPVQQHMPVAGTRQYIAEMIGPSGVGKTHLYCKVAPYARARWIVQDDLEAQKRVTRNFDRCDIHLRLLRHKLNNILSNPFPADRKLSLVQFNVAMLQADINAQSLNQYRVFFHDGICHNFAREIIECREPDDGDIIELMQNRAIIRITAPLGLIKQNLKDRHLHSCGALNDYWQQRNERSIGESVAACENRAAILTQIAAANNLPSVTINSCDMTIQIG